MLRFTGLERSKARARPSAATGGRRPHGLSPLVRDLEVCLLPTYHMPMRKASIRPARYTRKSFFVDPRAIDRARKALGVGSDAEAVRLAVDRVVEMEKFWRFMTESRASLEPGSIEAP